MSRSSVAVPVVPAVTRSTHPGSGEFEIDAEIDAALERLCSGDPAPRKVEEFEGPPTPSDCARQVVDVYPTEYRRARMNAPAPLLPPVVAPEDCDDDESTVELPAPRVPAHIPSPLGDEALAKQQGKPANDVGPAASVESDVDTPADTESVVTAADASARRRVREAAALAGAPAKISEPPPSASARSRRSSPRASRSSRSIDARMSVLSRAPRGITPEAVQAVRDARAAARREETKTELIVFGIWIAAVVLAGLFAFFILFK